MLRAILFLLGTLLWVQPVLSQEARQYSFTHYNVKNGLAAYHTNSVIQDDQGYIWISTVNGLQRFDGSRFITFRHNPVDGNSLPDNSVSQLLFDKQKNLWVLLGDGSIGIFDTRRFVFKKANVKTNVQKNLAGMRKLLEDGDGNLLYCFAFKEFITYNKEHNEFSSTYNAFSLPPDWRPTNIVDDPVGKKYWIASDSGISVYNRVTKKFSYRNHNTEQEPLIEQFGNLTHTSCYTTDSRQRLWFYNWPPMGGCSIYCYDLKNKVTVLNAFSIDQVIKKYHESAAIMEQKDGTIWISGLHVFAKYNEAGKSITPVYSSYINDQCIYYESVSLFEDREQNIWVTTSNNGLYVFNPAKQLFNSISHTNRTGTERGDGAAAAFIRTNNGDVLVSYWDEGLHRYDSNFRNIKHGIKNLQENAPLNTWCMYRLKDNNTICMVGQPAFIAFYDQAKGTIKKYEPPIFETRTILQVVEDKLGNLWLGSHSRGIYKWSKTKAVRSFEEGLYKLNSIPNGKVLKIMTDSKGFVWIGTETSGVYKVDPLNDSIVDHITDNGPKTRRLLVNGAAILEYNDSLMIIAGGGLNFYNTKKNTIRHITTDDGLPTNVVVSLQKDKAGYLWIGMYTGLCRMNIEKGTFTLYDRNDGMANDNFDVSQDYQLPDGRMLFGSTNDFVVFNPLDIKTNAAPPEVSITEFKVLNNSISVDSLMKLGKAELMINENSITISYSTLSYFNKNKLVYYYMLEGIDKEWKKGNEFNQAIYNYLPPNDYTFKIRAENADAVSSKITTLKIKISPPFWRSWWFYGLLILSGLVLFYLADRERLLRLKATQRLRADIALNLHHDVNTALGNINLLSEMARMKADKDITTSKVLIEQISEKSNDMIIAMDDMLWVIDPANDSMEKTLLRMAEFIDALRNRHEADIEINIEEKVKGLNLDMKLRHGFFFIFKTALRCMVQYSGAKQTLVNIDLQKNGLCLKMHGTTEVKEDDTHILKCSEEMKMHAADINAELDIQNDKGGAKIVLLMPVK